MESSGNVATIYQFYGRNLVKKYRCENFLDQTRSISSALGERQEVQVSLIFQIWAAEGRQVCGINFSAWQLGFCACLRGPDGSYSWLTDPPNSSYFTKIYPLPSAFALICYFYSFQLHCDDSASFCISVIPVKIKCPSHSFSIRSFFLPKEYYIRKKIFQAIFFEPACPSQLTLTVNHSRLHVIAESLFQFRISILIMINF